MSVAARAADIHGGPKIFKDVCRSYQSDMWPQHTWRKQRSSVELVEGTPLQRATDLQRTLICATLVQFQSCTNASCCWPITPHRYGDCLQAILRFDWRQSLTSPSMFLL